MPWRAKCYECGQEVPITRPLYGKQSLLAEGDLGLAIATYEAHPRKTDGHPCVLRRQHNGSAVSDAQGPLDNTQ